MNIKVTAGLLEHHCGWGWGPALVAFSCTWDPISGEVSGLLARDQPLDPSGMLEQKSSNLRILTSVVIVLKSSIHRKYKLQLAALQGIMLKPTLELGSQ
jgi:hypothetical protein